MRSILALTFTGVFLVLAGCSEHLQKLDDLGFASSDASSTHISGCPQKKKLIISVYERSGVPEEHVEALFMKNFIQKGYRVTTRRDLLSVIQEIIFQNSSITERDAAQIGRISNAHGLVIVEVTELLNDKISMSAKLVELETGDVIWMNVQSYSPNSIFLNPISDIVGSDFFRSDATKNVNSRDIKTISSSVGEMEQKGRFDKISNRLLKRFPTCSNTNIWQS